MRGQAREAQPAGLTFGQVKSWPSASVPDRERQIVVCDTIQEKEDLYRNAALGEYGLSAGDQVLLLPVEEGQKYLVLCKVVRA
jgi:hypothetical protein